MHTKEPWTHEFEESGGYDCMSAAFWINDPDGQKILVLDVADYEDSDKWEPNQQPHPRARADAARICAAINAVAGIETAELEQMPLGSLEHVLREYQK